MPWAGKGTGFVIPHWPDSVICVDIKRENWTTTAGFRGPRWLLNSDPGLEYLDRHALLEQCYASIFRRPTSPRFDRNNNLGGEPGDPLSAQQTIYHHAEHPSHLMISVLGDCSLIE